MLFGAMLDKDSWKVIGSLMFQNSKYVHPDASRFLPVGLRSFLFSSMCPLVVDALFMQTTQCQ
jgi:hypothetical protein